MELKEEKENCDCEHGGRGVGVMEHAPKNQFSHRRTIRLLRSGMTDWGL